MLITYRPLLVLTSCLFLAEWVACRNVAVKTDNSKEAADGVFLSAPEAKAMLTRSKRDIWEVKRPGELNRERTEDAAERQRWASRSRYAAWGSDEEEEDDDEQPSLYRGRGVTTMSPREGVRERYEETLERSRYRPRAIPGYSQPSATKNPRERMSEAREDRREVVGTRRMSWRRTRTRPSVVHCVLPAPIEDGTMSYDGDTSRLTDAGLTVGAVLRFDCDRDYQLVGAETIRCLETGQWSAAPPACQSIEQGTSTK